MKKLKKNGKIKCLLGAMVLPVALSQPLLLAAQTVPGDSQWTTGTNNAAPGITRDQIFSNKISTWSGNSSSVSPERSQMIQMAAVSLGSQAGMATRSAEIQEALLHRARDYDRAFNFAAIMLEPGFLPPVITQGVDAYNQPNDSEARAADCVFRIERPARIVSANPTWRTYLLQPPVPAARPDSNVLPKSQEEKNLWDQWAATGWNQGAQQADETFEANLARLRQDFQGMLRFKTLYEQGLVIKPQISRSFLGVTGGGDEMAINDRIIRITQKAAFDANTRNWSTSSPQIDPYATCSLRGPSPSMTVTDGTFRGNSVKYIGDK